MELNKCKRCGTFYLKANDVCPKCMNIENLELNTFKNFIEANGNEIPIDTIAFQTGISNKNINIFIGYDQIKN